MPERRCDIRYAQTAHEVWDPLGENHPEERALLFRKELETVEAIVTALPVNHRTPILEVACGQGRITQALREANHKVPLVAIDMSPHMLAIARGRVDSIAATQADALKIPAANNTFQLAVAIELTMHLSNLEELLRELQRVTLPEGTIIFDVCNPWSLYSLWRKVNPYSRRTTTCPPRGYSARQVEDCVAKVGLNLDNRYGVGAVYPLSLLSNWRGLIVSGTAARRLSDVLDPTAANRFASDQIFVCSKKA